MWSRKLSRSWSSKNSFCLLPQPHFSITHVSDSSMAVDSESTSAMEGDRKEVSDDQRAQSPDSDGDAGMHPDRKRKRFEDNNGRHGSRGKKRDLGRKEWAYVCLSDSTIGLH